jgi:hypothetical protein
MFDNEPLDAITEVEGSEETWELDSDPSVTEDVTIEVLQVEGTTAVDTEGEADVTEED